MPTENTTSNQGYQLPFGGNNLSVDVGRIIAAISAIDVDIANALGALAAKAGLVSPAFTGIPTAPTAAPGTDTGQLATTAFVKAALDALIGGAPGALDTLNELAAALADDAEFAATITAQIASKADASAMAAALALKADLASVVRHDIEEELAAASLIRARKNIGATTLGDMRNLLINSLGTINQRAYASGAATTSANQYTLDRWRVVTSGQSLSWTESEGVRTITAPVGGVEQVVEGNSILTGSYVLKWDGNATATVNGIARTSGVAFTLVGGSNATVRFSSGTFKLPQLERGASATEFAFRNPPLEMKLCEIYREESYDLNVAAGALTYNGSILAVSGGAYRYRQWVKFNMRKRTNSPNIAIFSPYTGASGKVYNETAGVDLSVSVAHLGSSGVLIEGSDTIDPTNLLSFHIVIDDEI